MVLVSKGHYYYYPIIFLADSHRQKTDRHLSSRSHRRDVNVHMSFNKQVFRRNHVGYPQIIHFNRVFHYKPSILGYPYVWKHPCMSFKLIIFVGQPPSVIQFPFLGVDFSQAAYGKFPGFPLLFRALVWLGVI